MPEPFKAARPSVPPPFGRIGKYTLLEPLAKGGMGQVYVAQREGSSQICVLKQLLGNLEEHPTAPIRFYREAQISAWLGHENIARVLDAGFEEDTFCIAFEYIPGRDLRSITMRLYEQQQMLPYSLSIAVGLGALAGLAHVHAAKDAQGRPLSIVHRDLTPRNILVSINGDTKLIDFGLARGSVGEFRTAPGVVIGTFRYVSPEQAVAEPVDCRADLYSLSVVLHELLTGRYVWHDGPPELVLRKVVDEVFPPASSINPALPTAVDAVLAKGLAKKREDRFSSAYEYAVALKQASATLPPISRDQIGRFMRAQFHEVEAETKRLLSLAIARSAEPPEQYLETVTRAFESLSLKHDSSTADLPVIPVDLLSPPAERLGLAVSPDAIVDLGADPNVRTRTDFVGRPQPSAASIRAPSEVSKVGPAPAPKPGGFVARNLKTAAVAGLAFGLGMVVQKSAFAPDPPAQATSFSRPPILRPKPAPDLTSKAPDPPVLDSPKPNKPEAPTNAVSKAKPKPKPDERPLTRVDLKPSPKAPEPAPTAPPAQPSLDARALARIEKDLRHMLSLRDEDGNVDHRTLLEITGELRSIGESVLPENELRILRSVLGGADFNSDPEKAMEGAAIVKKRIAQ